MNEVKVIVATIPEENVTAEVETVPASGMQKNGLVFSADGDEFVSFLKQSLRASSTLGRDIAPICIQANADGLGIRIINDNFSICAVAEGNEKIFSEGDVVIPRRAAEKLLGLSRLDRYQFQVKDDMFLVDDADGQTVLSLTTYAQGTKGHELFHKAELFSGVVENISLEIQRGTLKDMLDKTTYAIGGKLAYIQYQALHCKAQGNELTISATDRFRMAIANAHLLTPANATFSINRGAAEFLRKALTSNAESPLVLINVGAAEIQFRIGNLTLTTDSLICTPPPFEKLIPTSDDVIFTAFFNRAVVIPFLKVAKSIDKRVILEFGNDGIDMKAVPDLPLPIKTWQDLETGVVAKRSIEAFNDGKFAYARVAIPPDFLSDALVAQNGDGIIELTRKYIIVRTDNSIAVIAPMSYKVNGEDKTIEFANAPLNTLDVEIQNRAKQKVYASMQRQVPQIAANPILEFNSVEEEYWKKETLQRCC